MSRIIIHILTGIILSVYEFQKENIDNYSLVLLALLGFSFAILINFIKKPSYKFSLLIVSLILSLIYPKYSFIMGILAPSGFYNFGKWSLLIFLPLLRNNTSITLFFPLLLLFSDYILVKKDREIFQLREDKMDLAERAMDLSKSMDILKIESESEETLALQDERNRISREIHDTAGHTMSASILNLKALSLISNEPEVREGILQLKENLEVGLEDIRNVMYNLRDSSFDLENKIYELLESVYNKSFTYRINSFLDYSMKYDIYGIIREALTNFIKHSNGKTFNVYLVENEKYIVLKIEDDGFVEDLNLSEGLGIYSIKKRCEERNWNINLLTENGFGIHILMEKNDENTRS